MWNLLKQELRCCLVGASKKFLALVSRTDFIGRISEDAVFWCPFQVPQGSLVPLLLSAQTQSSNLVSLAPLKGFESNFPLSSLVDECTRHFGLDYRENVAHEAGNFFALATVFPSCLTSSNIFNIIEVLENDRSKKLIQTCTASWLCSRILLSGNLVIVPLLSRLCIFQVTGASPQQSLGEYGNFALSVDRKTKVVLYLPQDTEKGTPIRRLSPSELEHRNINSNDGADYPKLGGLSEEFAVLMDIIISSAVKGTIASMGLHPTKGVLLHGPPGTGKTALVQLCAHEAGVNLFSVNGPELIGQYYGESERALHEVFESASQAVLAVVFIDELDAIAPARKDAGEELSQRVVATADGVLVIAATNRPDSVEPALRRPGRLDREIEIGVPSAGQRYEILHTLLGEMEHDLLDKDVQDLATATHGFVGADLAALCNEAALNCLHEHVESKTCLGNTNYKPSTPTDDACLDRNGTHCLQDNEDDLSSNRDFVGASSSISEACVSSDIPRNLICMAQTDTLRINYKDFERARMKIRPSAMREVKMQLIEAVEWPQKHQEAFKRISTCPPTGVLMFGPPGCSKTLLARAIASEAGLNFLAVKGPELYSK
ncbi:unnamed protein product [Withania somnifera]